MNVYGYHLQGQNVWWKRSCSRNSNLNQIQLKQPTISNSTKAYNHLSHCQGISSVSLSFSGFTVNHTLVIHHIVSFYPLILREEKVPTRIINYSRMISLEQTSTTMTFSSCGVQKPLSLVPSCPKTFPTINVSKVSSLPDLSQHQPWELMHLI